VNAAPGRLRAARAAFASARRSAIRANREAERISLSLRSAAATNWWSIVMGKALILWMLGVPGVVVILLLVTHVI
jgi:hypothetical protein